ncbi:MAG TPA: hypothetical protein PK636_03510, partial [bacterium]|nr:hypothetical protein [bacterium]
MKARAIIAGILAGTLGGAAAVPGFTVKTGENGGFAHWGDGGGTIFYEVADPTEAIGDRELNRIETAFQTWAAPAHGTVRFVFTGRTRRPRAEKDDRNLLVWRKDWPYGADNLAMTTTWMNPETAAIDEVDIEFNARDYDWTDGGPVDLLTV